MIEKLDFAIQEVEGVLNTLISRGTIKQKEADILIESLYKQLQEEINKNKTNGIK